MTALRPRYPRLRALSGADEPVRPTRAEPRPAQGSDFTFGHLRGGAPVLWPVSGPIVVRAAGDTAFDELAGVVAELCLLTGLTITLAEPDPSTAALRVAGEIRVLFAPLDDPPAGKVAPQLRALGVGSAVRDDSGTVIASGFAVVDPVRCAAASTPVGAVLRHELGHALGLHHANRSGCVMSRDAAATAWATGDRVGLSRIGVGRVLSVSSRQQPVSPPALTVEVYS